MKTFIRIEPTTVQTVGNRYKEEAVIKNFQTEDGATHEFTTLYQEGQHSGAVIALTPKNEVIISYQFRAGPERWLYELPGGMFNDGENTESAALRELHEETGYVPKKTTFLGTTCRDSYMNATWFYYLATGCRRASDGQHLDAEERAQGEEVRLISISQLLYNAMHNQMSDPAAVLMAYETLKNLQEGKL
jgi:ADP-ribose pyrophosphatase